MLAMLFEATVRITLIAAVVAFLLRALRIESPNLRHAVWSGLAVLMLLMPGLVALAPTVSMPLPPRESQVVDAAGRLPDTEAPLLVISGVADAPSTPLAESRVQPRSYLLATYLLGFVVLLSRLLVGTFRAHQFITETIVTGGQLTHPQCAVPLTIGFLRPCIVLPSHWRVWAASQLEAILLHEAEHVRRRDPLIQWIALLNRAVFWFHPLAWWLERHLRTLAEEACDNAVLARGHDPRTYSTYLLELARGVERAGGRIPVSSLSMSGPYLSDRIARILESGGVGPLSWRRHVLTLASCGAVALILTTVTLAQGQPPLPAFEVASIRLNTAGGDDQGFRTQPGGLFTVTNMPLRPIIEFAFELRSEQLIGTSALLDSQRFDIAARGANDPSVGEIRLMLRTLLSERFSLRTHRETRNLPVYALTLARSDRALGPQLRRSNADCEAAIAANASGQRLAPPEPGEVLPCTRQAALGRLTASARTMSQLSADLSELVDRIVVDQTDLIGGFDLDLVWLPTELGAVADPNRVSIFTAIQEQLGLRLVPSSGPVDVLVVDGISPPTAN